MPQKPKKRVTFITWVIFWGLVVPLDILKFGLLFLNAIPVIGTGIDIIGSLFISFLQITVGCGGFWITGLYREGKNTWTNAALTFGIAALDLVPIADDLPYTSPSVLLVINRAKRSDKEDEIDYQKKIAQLQEKEREMQYERVVTARAVQRRVQEQNAAQAAVTP